MFNADRTDSERKLIETEHQDDENDLDDKDVVR